MKKMIQKLFALTTALALVLSMTAMVCNAEYTESENEYGVAPAQEDWFDNAGRN